MIAEATEVLFEDDVISYGTKTFQPALLQVYMFEDDVISYGTKTAGT